MFEALVDRSAKIDGMCGVRKVCEEIGIGETQFSTNDDQSPGQLVSILSKSIIDLQNAFLRDGLEGYDPADIYHTGLGRLAKRLWRKGTRLSFLVAAPLQILDIVFPQVRYLIAEKRKHAICYAQFGLACLTLRETLLKESADYLRLAEHCVDELMALGVRTTSGIGWGINLHWESLGGYIPPNTPCHTQTSYVFAFLDRLLQCGIGDTAKTTLLEIAEHTLRDYREFVDDKTGEWVTGYSTLDTRVVVNAISYRARILLRAGELFRNTEYVRKGLSSVRFVLKSQNADGSWDYSRDARFVDSYHTCFVLKNLVFSMDLLSRAAEWSSEFGCVMKEISSAIRAGYGYYTRALLNEHGLPTPFSVRNKPLIYEYDSYDLAEGIGVLSLFDEPLRLHQILNFLTRRMRTKDGLYRFRYYRYLSTVLQGMTYPRYANTALFLAMAEALLRIKGNEIRH
jgi:hypothetical protein